MPDNAKVLMGAEDTPTRDQIVDRAIPFVTPWFELVAKKIDLEQPPFYSLRMLDYVSIIGLTREGAMLLVRQYRAAVERYTLELPSGHVDPGESPEVAARRELLEETGYEADCLELLGSLDPDTGRLENRIWCYFAPGLERKVNGFTGEPGVELLECPQREVFNLIRSGELGHALHLAVLLLAVLKHGIGLFEDQMGQG